MSTRPSQFTGMEERNTPKSELLLENLSISTSVSKTSWHEAAPSS